MSTEPSELTVPVPKGVTIEVVHGVLRARGPLGRLERPFPSGALDLTIRGGTAKLALRLPPNRRESKALLHTWQAHVRNVGDGLSRGFEAQMKIVAAHFPMKVQARGEELIIENFLGEKHPRSARLRPGTKASVEGDIVTLTGFDVEQVGQSAANIERATHIRDYDPRVFQDGIYLTVRAHAKETG